MSSVFIGLILFKFKTQPMLQKQVNPYFFFDCLSYEIYKKTCILNNRYSFKFYTFVNCVLNFQFYAQ